MKKTLILKILLSTLVILLFIQNYSVAQYNGILNKIFVNGTIARPIIVVEKLQDTVIAKMDKDSENKEYYFKVKNYIINQSKEKIITEVDLNFSIEIKNSNSNFPIKYELYDCENEEKLLNGGDISEKICINKNIEFEKTYKLVVSWEDKNELVGNLDDIEIIVNIEQINN